MGPAPTKSQVQKSKKSILDFFGYAVFAGVLKKKGLLSHIVLSDNSIGESKQDHFSQVCDFWMIRIFFGKTAVKYLALIVRNFHAKNKKKSLRAVFKKKCPLTNYQLTVVNLWDLLRRSRRSNMWGADMISEIPWCSDGNYSPYGKKSLIRTK